LQREGDKDLNQKPGLSPGEVTSNGSGTPAKGKSEADFVATEGEILPMPSPTYKLIVEAMAERKHLLCTYDGFARELCVHLLGNNKAGQESVLAFQFAGAAKEGLPRDGKWKCLVVEKMSNVRLREGPWHGGESHARQQRCVAVVDYDVN